jgi:hypothetical protein
MYSPVGAKNSSPRRKPAQAWGWSRELDCPAGAKENGTSSADVLSPLSGLGDFSFSVPQACAWGYHITPLRGYRWAFSSSPGEAHIM